MTKLPRFAIGGVLLLILIIGLASPSAASCAPPLALGDAVATSDLVVIGTVTATRSGNRIATVAVEDIWKGDSASVIEVAGGPDAANAATSVDRSYNVGTRYLFFIFEPAAHGSPGTFGARYEDNNCSDTRPYTADLDSLRPGSAHRIETPPPTSPASNPSPARLADGTSTAPVITALLIAAVVVSGLVIAWRVRRRVIRPA